MASAPQLAQCARRGPGQPLAHRDPYEPKKVLAIHSLK